MSLALGGAALLVAISLGGSARIQGQSLRRAALAYERVFWMAAGVLVMTGIGNLASFGAQLPFRASDWGITLLTKLGFVVVLMLASVPRTLTVARLVAMDRDGDASDKLLGILYAGTVGLLVMIVALALWLSHG